MKAVKKILDIFPVPFWVYFFSILAGTTGLVPNQSPVYDWASKYLLPISVFLMLVASPVSDLLSMGSKALAAMAIATASIFVAQTVSYLLLIRFLPAESWKAVGALMGTWIGGSANMVAVKEILQLPDSSLSALIIADTIISYGWMAILLGIVRYETRFNKKAHFSDSPKINLSAGEGLNARIILVLAAAILGTIACRGVAAWLQPKAAFLPVNGWTLLLTSAVAIGTACSPLQRLAKNGAQTIGTYFLYAVLLTIGAKTTISATMGAPIFLVYGILTLVLHGAVLFGLGFYFRLPLFLLSTASQANIGGAVSAPIVAEAYRPGTAHIGVLMAVLGAVLGTYLGVAGGYLSRALAHWFGFN